MLSGDAVVEISRRLGDALTGRSRLRSYEMGGKRIYCLPDEYAALNGRGVEEAIPRGGRLAV